METGDRDPRHGRRRGPVWGQRLVEDGDGAGAVLVGKAEGPAAEVAQAVA